MALTVDYHGEVALVTFGDGENCLTPGLLDDFDAALDRITRDGAQGLVTRGLGRFYSNGLDLAWVSAHPEALESYLCRVRRLLARILVMPLPTAAAVTGHAFGAGAMLALAHDFRSMRADRGYFCLPEVDLGLPFHPGMAALVQAKLTPQAAVATMTTGRRVGGVDAESAGIVDRTTDAEQVVSVALDIVNPLCGKRGGVLSEIKQTMYSAVIASLTAD